MEACIAIANYISARARNRNDKQFIKPLLKKLQDRGIGFKTVLADAQYDSANVRNVVRVWF